MVHEMAPALQLRDYLRIVRRHKWLLLLTSALAAMGAVGIAMRETRLYQGDARVLLQREAVESLFNPSTGQQNDPRRALQTELEVLQGQTVQALVREKIGVAPSVSASPVGDTDVISVRATSPDAAMAAKIANAYAEAYIEYRRTKAVQNLLAAANEIQNRLNSQTARTDDLQRQISAAEASQQEQRARDLRSERDTLLQQQGLFRQKLDQLQVETSLRQGGAQVVTPATRPNVPVSPKPVRSGVLGAIVGLIIGLGISFLREQLDDTVKAKEDLERAVPGLPVLGLIPVVEAVKERGKAPVISIGAPASSAAEAYRTLRTSIQFMGLDRPLKTLQVTSATAREGKTTTIVNLAVALARAGQRVVLVDCDLRQPRVHEDFVLDGDVGFTSVLLGSTSIDEALQFVADEDRLAILTSGRTPPNPSELLSGRRAAEVFNALEALADIVLIDSPPVLPVTDAVVIAGRVDATLLVAMAGKTTRHALSRAREVLANIDAPVVGVVLNAISSEDSYGYGYRYGYYARAADTVSTNGESSAPRVRRRDR